MEVETWLPINKYKDYFLSDFGRIKRRNGVIPLFLCKTSGYYYVYLWKNNKKSNPLSLHRLIGKTFILNPDDKPIIDHINRIRTDNRVCNLRWATSTENNNNRGSGKH